MDITHITNPRDTPDPGQDSYFWSVELDDGRRGHVFTSRSAPMPDDEWVAHEVERQRVVLGRAFEGRLLSRLGLELRSPRPEEDTSAARQ